MKFSEQFPSKEIQALNIGKGAKEILKRNCFDKEVVRKAIDKCFNEKTKIPIHIEEKCIILNLNPLLTKLREEMGLSR